MSPRAPAVLFRSPVRAMIPIRGISLDADDGRVRGTDSRARRVGRPALPSGAFPHVGLEFNADIGTAIRAPGVGPVSTCLPRFSPVSGRSLSDCPGQDFAS